MSDEELDQWLFLLAPDPLKRIAVVTDLLLHANMDQMSPEDRAVCFRALRHLGTSFREQRMLSTEKSHPERKRWRLPPLPSVPA